jgi:DNA-binding response OmpR family regulator
MPRLLLVDDEPELLRALTVRLKAAGFACETARNGREALESIQREPPDLIVSDLLMPDVDGYELCRRLQSDAKTASIPLIMLTAVPAHAVERQQHRLAGAVRVMHKPFDSAILTQVIRETLTQHRTEEGVRHG